MYREQFSPTNVDNNLNKPNVKKEKREKRRKTIR